MAIKSKAANLGRPATYWQGYYAAQRDVYLNEARLKDSRAMRAAFSRVAHQFNQLSISYGRKAQS